MKRFNIQKTTLFLVLVFVGSFVFGQDKTLVGKVTTFDSIPLIGVDVLVKSTKQGLTFKTIYYVEKNRLLDISDRDCINICVWLF